MIPFNSRSSFLFLLRSARSFLIWTLIALSLEVHPFVDKAYSAYLPYIPFLLILVSAVLRVCIFSSFLPTHTRGSASSVLGDLCKRIQAFCSVGILMARTGRVFPLRVLAAGSPRSRGLDLAGTPGWPAAAAELPVLRQCCSWRLEGGGVAQPPLTLAPGFFLFPPHAGSSFIGMCVGLGVGGWSLEISLLPVSPATHQKGFPPFFLCVAAGSGYFIAFPQVSPK